MAKIIHDLSLADIAPPSIKNDETVRNIISAVDPELLSVSDAISEAFIISRIRELPEPVLDLLAWQWHVDFYELAHNIDAKRDMVLGSIQWHRKKGTRAAIISALEMVGVEAKFTAWYEEEENKNNPYTFAIDAKLTDDFWERVDWTKPTQTIRRAILESKAARSYMSRLYVHYDNGTEHHASFALGLSVGATHDIKIRQPVYGSATLRIMSGALLSQGIFYSIGVKNSSANNAVLKVKSGSLLSQGIFYEIN